MTAGYFARDPKIKTQDQMLETLKSRARTAAAQDPNSLRWSEPKGATQKAENGPYEVRGTRVREGSHAGTIMYWAWVTDPTKKLLGYSADPELARAHCQAHYVDSVRPVVRNSRPVSST